MVGEHENRQRNGDLGVIRSSVRISDHLRGIGEVWTKRLAALTFLVACAVLSSGVTPASAVQTSHRASTKSRGVLAMVSASRTPTSAPSVAHLNGTVDSTEPSGEAPPSATALPGYRQSYVNDFSGTALPAGWSAFNGAPGGDPGSLWASSHVVVGNGLLQLNTWQDLAHNNQWVSGGVSQNGVANTYGAYFVRSKLTGSGPTQVELLWPTVGWPPEIDFNETRGGDTSSVATLHFTSANSQEHSTVNIDMTQWHTWGVLWTPTSVTYTVDGQVWGVVNTTSEVPDQPMTLDITQQTWCSSGFACPTTPESTDVDWVAEYTS